MKKLIKNGLEADNNISKGATQVYLDRVEQDFKKAILLVGKGPSGKSRIARLFCKGRKAVTLDGRKTFEDSKFAFSGCDKDTEILVIDDLNLKKTDLEWFFSPIVEGVTVHKRGHDAFVIYPQIIITTDCTMEQIKLDRNFNARFDVFEINKCNEFKK